MKLIAEKEFDSKTVEVISMKMEELAKREDDLMSRVQEIKGTIEEKTKFLESEGIFTKYSLVHKEYASVCQTNNEALKRGLFIMWFAITEPGFLTGICELAAEAEEKIATELDTQIKNRTLDYELNWMLSYYANRDYVFERFKHHNHLWDYINGDNKIGLPQSIDKESMSKRGQMGHYWNSLNCFT